MRKSSLKRFRRIQMAFSVVFFFIVFITCWKITGFNLSEIALSRWGINEEIGWLWNGTLIFISISCFFNIFHYINNNNRLKLKKEFIIIFLFQCINIIMIGIINMNYYIHNIIAYLYFFTLPLCIFLFSLINRRDMGFNEWLLHFILSVSMILIPLILFKTYKGMAIAESTHSLIFIIWNLHLLADNMDIIDI